MSKSVLNRSHVRELTMALAAERFHDFTGVKSNLYTHLECIVRLEIARIVRTHPSKGKTIGV